MWHTLTCCRFSTIINLLYNSSTTAADKPNLYGASSFYAAQFDRVSPQQTR